MRAETLREGRGVTSSGVGARLGSEDATDSSAVDQPGQLTSPGIVGPGITDLKASSSAKIASKIASETAARSRTDSCT